MHISTPTEIAMAFWSGQLTAPTGGLGLSASVPPQVALSRPKIWPVQSLIAGSADDAACDDPAWSEDADSPHYWLLRLGCQLSQASSVSNIINAQLLLYMCPENVRQNVGEPFVQGLFPERLSPGDARELNVVLAQDLSFFVANGHHPDAGVVMTYHRVFPDIRGLGLRTCAPYWIFKPHQAEAVEGCQFVYTIIGAPRAAGEVYVSLELVATVNTLRGPMRFGLPADAKRYARFTLSS